MVKRNQTQVHLTSEPMSFAVQPTILCASGPAHRLHDPATQVGLGRLGTRGGRSRRGPVCPLPSPGQLHQGKAKLEATGGVPELSFIRSRGYLFSMQCKFPCLKTWNLVQLCLDQCPSPFKFWRKLLLSKVQTCQTQ